ncbi:response regulator [Cytophagaceae bacterium ABcell3]|nr:response regulator [Cytophagaceae bacterium ABcell3]
MMYKSFLLIDDDPINNFINSKLIKKLNLTEQIFVLDNGEEGIRFLLNTVKNELPDVILLDINMPAMNGFEFLELFGSLNISGKEHIKIFMLTSSLNPQDMQRVKHFQVHGYIQKPLTPEKLLNALGDEAKIEK